MADGEGNKMEVDHLRTCKKKRNASPVPNCLLRSAKNSLLPQCSSSSFVFRNCAFHFPFVFFRVWLPHTIAQKIKLLESALATFTQIWKRINCIHNLFFPSASRCNFYPLPRRTNGKGASPHLFYTRVNWRGRCVRRRVRERRRNGLRIYGRIALPLLPIRKKKKKGKREKCNFGGGKSVRKIPSPVFRRRSVATATRESKGRFGFLDLLDFAWKKKRE